MLDKLPLRLQPRAKRALHEMMYAERRADGEAAKARCAAEYQTKYAKAVESLIAHSARLVTFFDFPTEHWKHLRTTNVIESPFATVRLRERATKVPGPEPRARLHSRCGSGFRRSWATSFCSRRGNDSVVQDFACNGRITNPGSQWVSWPYSGHRTGSACARPRTARRISQAVGPHNLR